LVSAAITEPPSDREKVTLGAWVRLREGEGAEETYQIVGVEEADPGEGHISSASPLVRALLTGELVRKCIFKFPRDGAN
jgi:transcription elongation factor GreB